MLDKILDYKKLELEHIRRRVSLKDVQKKAYDAEPGKPLLKRFDDGVNIIAEVKKASPSAGIIREDFNAVDIATIYAENGAKALSVLTDENFFKGSLENLIRIKAHFNKIHEDPLPLLRKDFTLGEYHVFEARGAGADAILLIVAALDDYQLKGYQEIAVELGLTVLVEVHDKDELDRALKIKPALLGINNRNLKTFETSVQTTKDLKKHLDETYKFLLPYAGSDAKPPRVISESGIKDRDTILDLQKNGIDGFLIGESLMREKDFGAKLQNLIKGDAL